MKKREPDAIENARRTCSRFVESTWRRVRRNARRVDFEVDAPLSDIARAIYADGGYRVP